MMKAHRWFRIGAAALLLTAAGCSKKDDPAAKPGAAKGAATAAPTAKLEAPASVIIYGGTGPLAAAVGKLVSLARQASPQVPDLGQMVGPALQNEWRLKSPDAIDTGKPLRFAIFDPKTYGPLPTAVIVGVKDQAAFIKALPATEQKKDDAGNAISYLKFEGSRRPIYVNFVDGYAVVTRHKDAFPKHSAFMKTLIGATLPEIGTAWIEVDHLATIFKGELDAGFKQMQDVMAMAAQTQPGGADAGAMVGQVVTWFKAAIQDVDSLQLTLATVADGARLEAAVHTRTGSALAKQLGNFSGKGGQALLAKLPAATHAFMAFNADPAQLKAVTQGIMTSMLIGPMFGGDTEKAKPYVKAMEDYLDATDGSMALGAFPGADGVALAALYGVQDAAKAKAAQTAMLGMYTDAAAKPYYDRMGMTVSVKPAAYEVKGTPVTISTTTMNNLPPQAAQMMAMMGDFMTQHIAITEKLGVMAYGTSGKATIEGLLGGSLKTGLEQQASVKRALGAAAKNHFAFAWVNPIALARSIKLGGMNPMVAMLSGVEATAGLGLSAASEGEDLQMVIDVPLQLVKEGLAAFEKTKGAL